MVDRFALGREVEAHRDDVAADDDLIRVIEVAAVDVDREVSAGETQQRRAHGAGKLVCRGAAADRFSHGERHEIANAQRRRKRERARAAGGDCVNIERNANANHGGRVLPIFEEPPAARE